MTDLDKAREWAEYATRMGTSRDDACAAIDLIKSLPDQWVDAEKVLELADQLMEEAGDFASEGLAHRYMVIAKRLRNTAPILLPTLADMTQEERKACQWMQCKVETGDGDTIGVICQVWSKRVHIIFQSGRILDVEHRRVTPLPDLPKLEWPAQAPRNAKTPPAETLNNTSSDTPRNPRPEGCCGKCPETADGGYDCTCEDNPRCSKNNPRPEDVPPNEPWLIEADGRKAIGTRYQGNADTPWAVAALNGLFADDCKDSDVTLIHKLVPETHALPVGMRLADHEEYGRVVVSPNVDSFGDHKVFRSALGAVTGAVTGAAWEYCKSSELTFLDGADA